MLSPYLKNKVLPRLAVLALALPIAGFSAIIDANNVCESSPAACAAGPDTLNPGGLFPKASISTSPSTATCLA